MCMMLTQDTWWDRLDHYLAARRIAPTAEQWAVALHARQAGLSPSAALLAVSQLGREDDDHQ